jgi:hypothetical protein
MTRHERGARRQGTGVLLVIGAAQPAGLDAQQPVVGAQHGKGEVARLEPAGLGEHESAGHAHTPQTIR